jgi:hypothetical protein
MEIIHILRCFELEKIKKPLVLLTLLCRFFAQHLRQRFSLLRVLTDRTMYLPIIKIKSSLICIQKSIHLNHVVKALLGVRFIDF